MSEQTSTEDSGDTLRADIEAAIAETEANLGTAEPEIATQAAQEPAEATLAQEGAEPAQPPAEPASEPPEPTTPKYLEDTGHPGDQERYPTLTSDRVERAPEGWRPGAREDWAGLPEPVRREIHRRELDIATGLQEAAEARRFSEEFETKVRPFEQLIRAEGAESPLQAVTEIMNTVSQLRMGTPQERAARMAQLIGHYGVDISLLDSALASGMQPGAPMAGQGAAVPDPVQQAIDAKLKPVQEFMSGIQSRMDESTKQVSERANAAVAAFSDGREFIADVRLDMADLIDAAAAKGRGMTLEEAYDLACQVNPDVRAVIQARVAAGRTTAENTATEQRIARASAALVSDQPGTPVNTPGNPNTSLRQDLENAIEQLSQA